MSTDGFNYDTLQVDNDAGVLTCTFNRPETRNAVNLAMHHELTDFFLRVADDRVEDAIDVVVLTGAGRGFCSGGDMKQPPSPPTKHSDDPQWHPFRSLSTGSTMLRHMLSITQPIIASVNGDAVGLGATFALFCDIVLAADTARLGDPHVLRGLVAGDGGAVVWPLLTSANVAKEFLMTGDLMDAATAERHGLFNHVYPAASLGDETMKLARRLQALPAPALRWTKQSVNKVMWERMNLILDTSLALERINQITHAPTPLPPSNS